MDLCRLAGLNESSVICEIIKDDGTMARRDDLDIFAKEHDLNIVYISDIVEYRLANEILVTQESEEQVEFFGMKAKQYCFKDHNSIKHTAIVFHNVGSISNVKVHNVIPDIELLLNQQKYQHLIDSIEYLKQNSGVLVFINKPFHEEASMREYGIGAQILKSLHVKSMNLITSSKQKELVGLSGFGLDIHEMVHL